MKLSTRIKVAYLFVFVVPIVLILAMVGGVARMSLSSLQKKYDMDTSSYEMIFNPMSMMSHIAASTVRELETTISNDPDRLLERDYQNEINQQLGSSYSYLVVRKDNDIIFSGFSADSGNYSGADAAAVSESKSDDTRSTAASDEPDNESQVSGTDGAASDDTRSTAASDEPGNESQVSGTDGTSDDVYSGAGDRYVVYDDSYCIKQMEMTFSDGSSGTALIYTDAGEIIPQTEKLLLRIVVLAVIILFAVSAAAMLWLYRSMISPIRKLKNAAENITAGNLNVSVTAESDDEIGELCNAFEAMRVKLKGQIEQNIQYERDSKELISNISHDLKTPMTSIKGYIEGLKDGVADTPEKQEKYIKTIYNKVNDMNSLIDELFLYAKLDSNSISYQFVKLNISEYFQDCADEISLDMESQGIDFGYYNYLDKSTIVIADPEQLKRVINNIVGNSVKYAYPGRPLRISIRVMEEAEFVRVEIEDNGRGIARREVPLIFDRLYRTDASRNSTKGGSGLGLSIAKKIIEEHGGKIWARSTEGVGTTMTFVLRKYKEPDPQGQDNRA